MESIAQTELEIIAQSNDPRSQELDLEAYWEAYNAVLQMASESIDYVEDSEDE